MRSAQANLRIGVALNRELKAVRDEIAGIFGYASHRPHWEVRLLDRKQSPREFRRFAESWRLDGLIVDDRAHDLLGERTRRTCPTVFIDSCRPHEHSVEIDNRGIAERAADILLRRHYASYAFVGTDDRYAERHSREREDAFFSRIAAAGFACSTFVLASSDAKRIAGESQRLVQWLKALPKPCGLLVCSDLFAKTVYDACRRARLSVPDQLAILGVDNEIEIDEQLTPSLSSVLPDFTGAGRLAAELLEKALNGRRTVRRKLHARYGVKCVVERESTQDARGAGQLVAAARELIRAQALSGITVESVVQGMNISRRTARTPLPGDRRTQHPRRDPRHPPRRGPAPADGNEPQHRLDHLRLRLEVPHRAQDPLQAALRPVTQRLPQGIPSATPRLSGKTIPLRWK